MIGAADAQLVFARLERRFSAEEQALNALDAMTGDGDHGATMLRGARAACVATQSLRGTVSAEAIFMAAGTAFQASAGGAGGTLVAQIFKQIAVAGEARGGLDLHALREGIAGAAAAVTRLGRAKPGDKTLLDALVPAACALERDGADIDAAVAAAGAGLEATRSLTARVGRARHVAAAGVGSLDPGARSVVIILETLAEVVQRRGRSGHVQ